MGRNPNLSPLLVKLMRPVMCLVISENKTKFSVFQDFDHKLGKTMLVGDLA